MTRSLWLALALPAILLGCTRIDRDAGFEAVERTVGERIPQRITWEQTPKDEALETRLRERLSGELTADDAVQVALVRNRELQSLYEELTISQADLVAAGLLNNPVFSGEVRFQGGSTALEMSLVQDFLDVFFLPLKQRIAGSAFEAAKLRVSAAVLSHAADVRRRYIRYQAAEALLEMRHTVLTATDASYELAIRLHRAGNITDLDLANEAALHEQARLDASAAETAANVEREKLTVGMGVWGKETKWRVPPRLSELPPSPTDESMLESTAIRQSLELQAARIGVQRASERMALSRPYVLLGDANIGASGERETDGDWTVGPAFSLPIPLFNTGAPAFTIAAAEYRKAAADFYAAAVEVRAEARAAATRETQLYRQAEHYARTILPLRRRIVEETQRQYNAMQVGAFQLLQAKKDEIEAGASYVETLRDYWLARADAGQIASGARVPLDAAGSDED